jgi:hypothetical protein
MAGQPRKRKRRGEPVKPWRDDPSLSTRPPFVDGNLDALRHGADSPRMVAPLAQEFERALLLVAPWTARPAFDVARASLARVEAQLALLHSYLDAHGLLDDDGQPPPAANRLNRLEARASTLRGELGLTPLALTKLLGTLAGVAAAGGDEDTLAALKREGAAILAARESAALKEAHEPSARRSRFWPPASRRPTPG